MSMDIDPVADISLDPDIVIVRLTNDPVIHYVRVGGQFVLGAVDRNTYPYEILLNVVQRPATVGGRWGTWSDRPRDKRPGGSSYREYRKVGKPAWLIEAMIILSSILVGWGLCTVVTGG
jgi:hypothetical protein